MFTELLQRGHYRKSPPPRSTRPAMGRQNVRRSRDKMPVPVPAIGSTGRNRYDLSFHVPGRTFAAIVGKFVGFHPYHHTGPEVS
ncbi:hypothetical protein NITMOv2_1954 [Nitrospira moscoviensis]|uniref:Uncharacterized protein n=1 Tax=Nitrospira moscoviensis TaxID=42253 RepID=A0A0K2GBM9_NITMO|nr:hypothetical protein NITMOv2_1954 [Nitrospira moscoviensis]